jgi:hypothetical protein
MRHYTELDTKLGCEEDWYSEEDAAFDLQCGDSLSVAVNHIGKDAFGVKKFLLHGLRRLHGGRCSL